MNKLNKKKQNNDHVILLTEKIKFQNT